MTQWPVTVNAGGTFMAVSRQAGMRLCRLAALARRPYLSASRTLVRPASSVVALSFPLRSHT